MAEQLQFELVSPEQLLVSKAAVMVTLPGEMGCFGVLPGHAPIIASLGAGVVDIYENEEKVVTDRFFVAGGFAEVNEKGCTLLAEEALAIADLDAAQLDQEVKDLTEDLETAEDDKRQEIEAKLMVAQAKLFAATNK